MIDKIVEELRTKAASTSPNMTVVRDGEGTKPPPPYTVVADGPDALGRGIEITITAHFSPGQQTYLDTWIRGDVGEAMEDFEATDWRGNTNTVERDFEYNIGRIVKTNDDGTISKSRVFWMPSLIF